MIVVVSNIRVDVGMARKIRSYASAHAAFLRDLLFADAVQYPQNWVAGGGAGGFRVLVIVTAVCVVAADDDSVDGTVTVAGVDSRTGIVK